MTDSLLHTVKRVRSAWGMVLILALTALVYSGALRNGFVWDDWVFLVGNDVIAQGDLHGILLGKANPVEYLPVRDLTLAADAWIGGMRPFGFHLTNLVLYLAVLAALYAASFRLASLFSNSRPAAVAFWTTALFALHPLNAEAVNFIAARNVLLAGLFLFLSLNVLLQGLCSGGNGMLALSLVLFIAAGFSKAAVVFYPAFVAVLLYTVPAATATVRKKTVAALLFAAVGAALAWIHFRNASASGVMNDEVLRFGAGSMLLALAKAVQIPFYYLRMIFVPYPLTVDHETAFLSGRVLVRAAAAGAGICAILVYAWRQRGKQPLLLLGTTWFLLSLVPVLNLFPTTPVVADRYAFFAVFGVALAITSLTEHSRGGRVPLLVLLSCGMLIGGGLVAARTADWKSDIALWEAAIRVNPDCDRSRLAAALWKESRYEEALEQLREERRRTGTYRYNLYRAKFALLENRFADAEQALHEALAEGGDPYREVHLLLGKVYETQGAYPGALASYLKAQAAVSPNNDRGEEQAASDGIDRMRRMLAPDMAAATAQARKETGSVDAQVSAAVALHALGLYEEAEAYYAKALHLQPASWQLWYNIGLCRMKRLQWSGAVEAFEQSRSRGPENPDVLNNMGIALMHLKRYDRARQVYLLALKQNPSFFFAVFNLARSYFISGDRDRAREFFSRARQLAAGNRSYEGRIDQYLRQL